MAPPGPITTPLTSLLGIKHPIILAGMARVSGGRLAAAVSNAGGLGIIGGFQYTPDQLREIIAEMKANFSRPDLPFGVDLALPQIGGNARKTNHDYTGGKLDELVDIIIDSGAKLFVSAVGVPPPQVIKRFHDKGILVMNMVGHPKHATKALELGVDMGAVGVWVGTRFVASVEASCSEEHKKEVVSCGFEDTQRTLVISGRPLRMKTNDYIRKWHEQPDKIKELCDKGVVPIEYDFEQGNDFDLPHLMGQVAGAITKIQPAGEIVDEMVKEAVDMLKLGGTYLTAIPRLAALTMPTSSDEESYSYKTSISDEELDYNPCQSCVLSTNCLENVFPALDTEENQFAKMPDTDYILISLDFHHICVRELSVSIDGPSYRQDPIIEAGVAYLDMRDILYDRGKGVMPGDRGSSWFKYMTPLHYIVEEFENQDESDQSPYLFAFGRSRRVQEKDLAYRLYRVFSALRKKNRRKEPVKTALLQLALECRTDLFQRRLNININIIISHHTNITHTNKSLQIIEDIITMSDNEVADKNIAHNEVINDKSIDDKMADEKINDNKTTEEITAEEKIEETSKDNEMTDAQHSDGESAEDEIVSLSAIRQLLFPDMPDLFFNAISKENLGLPSQFHWPSAYEWLRKVTVKFHSKGENTCKDTEGKKNKLEGRVIENAKVLEKLLEETPEPFISGKDKRPITDKDLDYFIADLDYFAEVEDDGNEESETLDEEDEHDSDYELPWLDDFSHSPER
ncbi:hypothetical protein ACJA88_000237 [Fusarium oxysporum]